MTVNIGITEEHRSTIAEGLCGFLADSYTLYLKTQNFHWNVTGPMFHSLHAMFEAQYTDLATAIDEIAERIRALGHYAPGSYTEFTKRAHIQDQVKQPDSAEEMVSILVKDHETLLAQAREVLNMATEGHDDVTVDFLTGRMHTHEKTAWMLRSVIA